MLRRLIFLIGCAFVLHYCAKGQNRPWTGFGIESNVISGRILKHTPKFKPPIPARSAAYEVNFLYQTHGNNEWQQRRKYPIIGLGVAYTDYGIDSIYGKCISVFPNLQLPLIKGKHFEWTIRAAFGLGYITKRYERIPSWDTINNVIGSRFNNYSVFATDIRYRVNTHWDVQAGLNFSHVSNAALRSPNLGINMYGAHIGLRYFPVSSQPELLRKELPKLKNRWLLQARLGIAGTESGIDGALYPIYLASVYGSRRYSNTNKVFAGLDYCYDEHVYAFLRNNEILPGKENANSWSSSAFLGNEFIYGRIGILIQLGFYLKNTYLKSTPYYEKLGCNVYILQKEQGILKELTTSILLKAQSADAQLVEIGVGAGF